MIFNNIVWEQILDGFLMMKHIVDIIDACCSMLVFIWQPNLYLSVECWMFRMICLHHAYICVIKPSEILEENMAYNASIVDIVTTF